MKRIGTLALAAYAIAFSAVLTGTAFAGAAEGSWYIAPQIDALWLDDDRVADDDAGVELIIGKTINAKWDAEFSLFGSEHQRAGDAVLELQGFGISANRVFYREGRVNPYFSFGVAQVKNILKPGVDDDHLTALYGVGLLITLGEERDDGSAMQLRANVGGRRVFDSGDNDVKPIDYIAGIGIQYSWGGKTTPRVVDSDGDGVNDDVDRCPGTPAGTAVDSSGCPLPQDDDGDGVMNDNDKCPGTPAGKKVDAAGCEVDGDDDGDGILNSVDQCPNSPAGTRVNNVGCPFDGALLLQGVKFATNSADLLPESIPVLENAIATLKRYPNASIEVAGYTDSRGSDAYNLDLSARRAASVLKYLRDGGVTNTLTSKGYGETDPIASNDTDEGRQQNRRVILRPLN